ncbi:MAG: acyl-CoA thioesterase [Acidimicrobiales bacterium]|nr:acyl-CoA thioesterase [Acidimicrobiales bacterium]
MTIFESDTAVRLSSPGVYEAHVDEKWWVFRGPNGGYISAILLRAMTEAVGDPGRPARSLTVHFLSPPAPGQAHVEVAIERVGRSLTSTSARLLQDGRLVATALAAFSGGRDGPEYSELEMPSVPPAAEVPTRGVEGAPPHTEMFDFRPAVGGAPFTAGDEAVTGGWFRFREAQLADPVVMTAYADGWFPAVFSRTRDPIGVPTVDLTVHFREPLPLSGASPENFYLVVFRAPLSHGGFMVEDGEIWSSDGRLVAQARQLAVVLDGR